MSELFADQRLYAARQDKRLSRLFRNYQANGRFPSRMASGGAARIYGLRKSGGDIGMPSTTVSSPTENPEI